MKILQKIPAIEVKRTFVIADYITQRKNLGNNRKFLKDLSEKDFEKKLLHAKKVILKLKEKELDLLVSPKWPKRIQAYNSTEWFLAEVDPHEIGVWVRAGEKSTTLWQRPQGIEFTVEMDKWKSCRNGRKGGPGAQKKITIN